MYQFEKLRVYQHAIDLVENIYQLTKLLPKNERFALIDQLKRAAISITLNIAEGSARKQKKDFTRFLRISLGSLYETIAALKIAERLYNIDIKTTLEKCHLIGKELNALINSLKPKTNN